MAFGIGAAKIRPMVNLIVAFVMFSVTIPTTFAATFIVPERPVDERKVLSDDDSATTGEAKVVGGGVGDARRRDG